MASPSILSGPVPGANGKVRRLARRAISLPGEIARRAAGSPWLRPLGKVAVGLAGLTLLACIGQYSARASVHPAPSADMSLASMLATPPTSLDAGQPAPLADASDAAAPRAHLARATPDDPVVLNTATVDDLRRLPGIGEKRAMAILTLRVKLGRFRQIEDLLRVRGIGRKTLSRLRPLVRLDAQT